MSAPRMPTRPLELFYSYSHKDEALRDQLDAHLKLLQRQGVIASWHDREISAGDEWKGAIEKHLNRADIILLLVSSDFIDSDFCWSKELTRALERHAQGEARVIPIILRACDWHSAPFGRLQALPKDGKPITSWPNRDEAFADVARGIRREVEGLEPNPSGVGVGAIAPRAVTGPGPWRKRLPGIAFWAVAVALLVLGGFYVAARLLSGSTPLALSTPAANKPGATLTLTPDVRTPSAFQYPLVSISNENAAQVTQLAIWDQDRAYQVFWSPDGSTLAAAADHGVYFLDTRTLHPNRMLEIGSGGGSSVAFSSDWKMVAVASFDGIKLWDQYGAEQGGTFAGGKNSVAAAFSRDGKLLATKTGDAIIVWDVSTGEELRTLGVVGGGTVGTVAFSPDGKILAGGGQSVVLWDTTSWNELRPLSMDTSLWVQTLAFSRDGKLIAGGTDSGAIRIWDVSSGLKQRSMDHKEWVHGIAFSLDGSLLATASWDATIKLWDVATGQELRTLTGHTDRVNDLAFSPDGKLLASGGIDSSARLWGVPR